MRLKCPSKAACTTVTIAVLLVATSIFAQQLGRPSADDATTARLVCSMISRYHIDHSEIDDSVAPQLFERYFEVLDPQKLYFLKSDVDEFARRKMQLDDQVKEGDLDFAYEVFDRYRKRFDQRIDYVHRLIDMDHDFTVDEKMKTDSESLSWAADEEEVKERWRRRVKYDILNRTLDEEDGESELEKVRERLHKRYNTLLRSVHETETGEVLEMYLSSLTHCFDPHSSYLSPQSLEEFRIAMQLSLEGIGAALRSEDGYTFVASIVKGGAADKDGRLEVDDKIIGVAQETGEFVDIVEMKLSKVVRLIRGKRGTIVRLQVQKGDTNETVVYKLTRQKIELAESAVQGEIIETTDRIGRRARIGVINIPSFYRDFNGAEKGLDDFKSTARDLQQVLLDFREEGGVDALVVDLRYNGGGALSEAIEVTGLFIDEGPVVQVKEPGSKVETYSDDEAGAFNEPLIVLCNRMSASASEIFAGAIKDYRRGIVIGDSTTHGKGTVQNVMPVSPQMFQFFNRKERGALKLTINQFYRINGDSTQSMGVKSDIVLPSLLDHMDVGEASLDNALEFDRIEATDHDQLAYVNGDVLSRLKQQSQQRVAKNEEFGEIQESIESYLERKNRQAIPLNAEKLRAERQETKEELEDVEDEASPGQDEEDEPVLPKTAYNDEVLNIAVDYVELLRGSKTAQR